MHHFDCRLLGVILHGFMVNYPITEKLLQSKDMMAKMISAILNNMKMFIHAYDKKVRKLFKHHVYIQQIGFCDRNQQHFYSTKHQPRSFEPDY